jgi:hypothetical protein
MKKKKIQVSELFLDIYKYFNVNSQIDKMQMLTRKELFLLLILAIDNYSEDSTIVVNNLMNFRDELENLYKLQNDEVVNDIDLIELSKLTSEKYIDTNSIITMSGESLPPPTTEEEAILIRRDIGINQIIE